MDIDLGHGWLRRVVRGVERQCGRARERGTHQCQGAEHVGPHQRAPRGDRCSEIVPGDQRYIAITKGRDETQRIPDRVQKPEGSEVAIIVSVPAGGASVAPQIGGYDMKSRRGERQHDSPPGEGEFREAVQQQDRRPSLGVKAGLQHVYPQPVDVGHEAGANARSNHGTLQRPDIGHARLLAMCRPSLAEKTGNESADAAVCISRRPQSSAAP